MSLPSDGVDQCKALQMPASRSGSMPFVNVKRPPSWDGMFSGSMYFSSMGETSLCLRNMIFSAVTGSTNFLSTPHIVVMYEETLQTWSVLTLLGFAGTVSFTHEDAINGFWIAGCQDPADILRKVFQVPSLLQRNTRCIDQIDEVCNRHGRVWSVSHRRAERQYEPRQAIMEHQRPLCHVSARCRSVGR